MRECFLIKKNVLLILPSSSFNEHEYLIIKRELEKARIGIFIASNSNLLCTGSDGLKVKSDVQLYNIHQSNFAGIILIGGKGVKDYWNNFSVLSAVKSFHEKKKLIGAICSASVIIANANINIECATCYPENKTELEKSGIKYKDEKVIVSENVITGRDPDSAYDFIKTFIYELFKRS